ncbi:MAG TPA: helix-hairpin-helix domain-containing protein [Actinomycetota bacterium]|jgi:competence protein ComEA|nr:helix-hairpin-helix domain-containing protein [Actinomycetota bacterium]
MDIRERLDGLSRGELVGLIVIVVALLAGVGLWYTRSLPRPVDVATTAGSAAPVAQTSFGASPTGAAVVAVASGSASASASSSASPALIVDVAGAVRKPGVFEFQPGDRVIDAVERAGGALDKADLTLLNLAAPLTDGQQILVPKKGAAVPSGVPVTGGVPGGSTTALVNINTADEPTLETLNGVGPVLGAAIIQYRTEHGPFASIDQLDEVSGIGPATLEDLRSQVTV